MSLKNIIDIDVNDGKFKAFFEVFQKFNAQIGSMPDSWKKSADAINKNKQTFGQLFGQAKQNTVELSKATKAMGQFDSMAESASKAMSRMAKDTKEVGKELFNVSKFLLKIGAVGFATIGAGIWGLDALGNRAVQGQRQARGLGLTQGQVRAFGLDFGRFVDPSMLNSIANAQADFTNRVYLARAAGVSYGKAGSEDVAQLAIQTAIRAHNWWNNTPANMRTQQTLQAAGFSQIGYSIEDIRRLGNTPLSELQTAQNQYGRDKNTLNISNNSTQAWYQFTRQLTLAGNTIENTLTNKLAALAPSLGTISMDFAKDVDALISGITPKQIQDFADGIKSFAKAIASPETLQNIKNFATAMGDIADFVLDIAKALHFGGKALAFLPPFNMLVSPGQAQSSASSPVVSSKSHLKSQLASYTRSSKTLDVSNTGGNWERNAPNVRDYINQTLAQHKQAIKLNVSIHNKTGSDIFTSANAMANS